MMKQFYVGPRSIDQWSPQPLHIVSQFLLHIWQDKCLKAMQWSLYRQSLYRQGKGGFEGGAGVTARPIFVPYRKITPETHRVVVLNQCAQYLDIRGDIALCRGGAKHVVGHALCERTTTEKHISRRKVKCAGTVLGQKGCIGRVRPA